MMASADALEAERRISAALESGATRLDLGGLNLRSVPSTVVLCSDIEDLNLAGNRLTAVPEGIGHLKRLRTLALGGNRIRTLPPFLAALQALEQLRVNDNLIDTLPAFIAELRTLRVLHLSRNRLTTVPDWIGTLCNLQRLDLSGNLIRILPNSIGGLASLRQLSLDDNGLESLPIALGQLTNLVRFFLHGNPALGLPLELLGPTWRDLKHNSPTNPATILEFYFRTSSQRTRPLHEAKLVLLGRGGVGKTSLVQRLLSDDFKPGQKTDGIQVSQWTVPIDGKNAVRLHIWDFGGQEILHGTHQFFLTERTLYLVVLSGREGREDEDAEYWLTYIDSLGGDSPVIVVLNKSKSHAFDINSRRLEEKFPGRIRGYVATDCEDGTGCDALRQAIRRELGQLSHVHQEFPTSWFAIKERLSTMTDNFLSYEQFCNLNYAQTESDRAAV